MSDRRFHAGDTFVIPPLEYRVVAGKKGPGDLRLDWRWCSGWEPVPLDHLAVGMLRASRLPQQLLHGVGGLAL